MSSNTQLEDNNRPFGTNTGYDSSRAQQQPEYDSSLVGDGGQQDYPRGSGAGTYLLFLLTMPILLICHLQVYNATTGSGTNNQYGKPEGTTPAQYDSSLVGDSGEQDYPRGSGAGTYLLFLPTMPIYLSVIYKFIIQQDLEPTINMGVTRVIRWVATKETQI